MQIIDWSWHQLIRLETTWKLEEKPENMVYLNLQKVPEMIQLQNRFIPFMEAGEETNLGGKHCFFV